MPCVRAVHYRRVLVLLRIIGIYDNWQTSFHDVFPFPKNNYNFCKMSKEFVFAGQLGSGQNDYL